MRQPQRRDRDVWPQHLIEYQDDDLRVLKLQEHLLAVKYG